MDAPLFHPRLHATVETLLESLNTLSAERLSQLAPLSAYVLKRVRAQQPVHLNYICTHNSRRSHLGQVWGKVAATHFGIPKVTTFSGGTEATEFNSRAVAALERDGFVIQNPGGNNAHYKLSLGPSLEPLVCFSKTYDDPVNRSEDFAAVMTCTHADQHCPAVLGAARISLPYEDPKAADGTPDEAARYSERSAQIGREMLAAFKSVRLALDGS